VAHKDDWKKWEREVASDMGGRRFGPLGESMPDVDCQYFAPECKLTSKMRYRKDHWEQATRNAGGIHKIPVLCIKERETGHKMAFLSYDDFIMLYNYFVKGKDRV
jgi:hypothetical protein